MLSETLNAGLARYGIGPKIRALRQAKLMGQVQLAQHTGLSPALLSKIERGQLHPTLPTLLRIAMVFGVGLEHFFTDPDRRPPLAVTRRQERLRLPERPGENNPSYLFESLNYPATDRVLEVYLAEFPPLGGPTQPHQHPGTEFIYVLVGSLCVTVAGENVTLADGDTLHFQAGRPHSYRRGSEAGASAIVVVVP